MIYPLELSVPPAFLSCFLNLCCQKQLDYLISYLYEMLSGNYANVVSIAILSEIKV